MKNFEIIIDGYKVTGVDFGSYKFASVHYTHIVDGINISTNNTFRYETDEEFSTRFIEAVDNLIKCKPINLTKKLISYGF